MSVSVWLSCHSASPSVSISSSSLTFASLGTSANRRFSCRASPCSTHNVGRAHRSCTCALNTHTHTHVHIQPSAADPLSTHLISSSWATDLPIRVAPLIPFRIHLLLDAHLPHLELIKRVECSPITPPDTFQSNSNQIQRVSFIYSRERSSAATVHFTTSADNNPPPKSPPPACLSKKPSNN